MRVKLPDVERLHARKLAQLKELSRLAGKSEDELATEFAESALQWEEFYKVKLWECRRVKNADQD